MRNSYIAGVGHYVPERIVTNKDLEKLMDTSDEWIVERTGIRERRFFTPGKDTVSGMGAKAAEIALQRAGMDVRAIELIVFATLTPDYFFPGSGVLLQRELGLAETAIPAIDIRNQCSGFVYGLSVADQFLKTGMYKTALVIGSEIQSNVMEFSDRGRSISVIFGDGAGAVVLASTSDKNKGILSTHLYADGRFAEELALEHPGSSRKERITHEMLDDGSMLPYMNGNMVFKHAVTRMPEVIMEALETNGMKKEDLAMVIPHQANLRIINHLQEVLGLSKEQVYSNIQRYGNTTAGSVPIALSEAWGEGKIKEDDLVCLAAFGSGFTWASALIRW